MTVEELHDEISAIDAIYPGQVEEAAPHIYWFRVAQYEALRIQLNFPSTYPETRPEVLQISSTDPRLFSDQRYIEKQVDEAIDRIFQPGLVCIFELITELEEFLETYTKEHAIATEKQKLPEPVETPAAQETVETVETVQQTPKMQSNAKPEVVDPLAGWIQSEPLVDRGSTFIAFVREVHSVEEATGYVSLLTTDRKIVRATHNITSWRIKGENGVQFQDCDDDGETAAGGRLLHLLTMMDVWNLVVVVSRWFGGTHLGPDRFKHINSVAREGVLKAGFANGELKGADKKKKK